MTKRHWLAVATVIVLELVYDFVLHGLVLEPRFYAAARGTLWRTTADSAAHVPFSLLAYASFAVAAVWLYAAASRRGPAPSRIRFGLAVTGVFYLPWALIWYATMPVPSGLAAIWIWSAFVEGQLVGWVVASVSGPASGHIDAGP